MKSRVDESDADNPQEAPSGASGAPGDDSDTAPVDPLTAFFGIPEQSDRTDAAASAGSRERLASLFAKYESDRPAAPSEAASREVHEPAAVIPRDDPTAVELIEPERAHPADRSAGDAPAGAAETVVAGAPAVEISEILARRRSGAAAPVGHVEAIDGGAPVDGPPAEDPSLRALDELFAPHGTGRTGDTGAMPVTAPERDTSLVPATAAGAASTPAPPSGPGTFAPSRTARRGVRGALFGSRARTITSVTASVVLIAALVAGVVYGAQTLAASARLSEARTALESAEAAIASPTDVMASAYDTYDATAATAQAMTDGAAPALAAVAGMTDQAALDAANAASAALVEGLASEVPPPAPAEYERADVAASGIDEVAAAEKAALDYAEDVLATINATEKANNALRAQVTAFETALDALAGSLPTAAAAIAEENPLAEQTFRDAVIAAADAVVAARTAGGLGDAELLAYAGAVTALRDDQARAVDEAKARNATRPRSGTTNPGTTTPTTPATPTPAPTPTPSPTPTPAPEPSEPPPTTPVPDPIPTP